MTSTELKIGLTSSARPSSRILKPPGGGHSNIFAEPEVQVNAPRPKYNQQNSSNLNACIGSTDPNQAVVKLREEIIHAKQDQDSEIKTQVEPGVPQTESNHSPTNGIPNNNAPRGRIPPGGYSSGGFW